MRAVKLICSAVLAISTLSLPALAGEPGPNFRPAPTPAPAPAPAPHTYYQSSSDWGHSSSSGNTTRDLNLQSMHSIRTVQPAPSGYSYSSSSAGSYSSSSYSSASSSSYSYSSTPTRTYTTTSSGCYTPDPCTTHRAPTTTTTTRTYVRPATSSPCYQPNPCDGAPVVHYQPAPAPAPAPAPHTTRYDWLAIEECRENTVRRLPRTRDGERQYEVCYADLMHMSDYERNSELLERIETASRRACRDGLNALYSRRATRSCREEATLDAVYAANLPGLVDLYNHREGRYVPNVNVGRPIMN